MIRSPWRPHFSQSICSPGRTCLFCLSCSQGYVPWLDKKSCWWLIISLSMMAIVLITSNSLFCLARNIKLFWLFAKYSPIPLEWIKIVLKWTWNGPWLDLDLDLSLTIFMPNHEVLSPVQVQLSPKERVLESHFLLPNPRCLLGPIEIYWLNNEQQTSTIF